MHLVHIVALLAVLQYLLFGFMVGRARGRYGVKAPATSGNEHFEREFRVQMNTLEQLVGFMPALLIAAVYWPDLVVAAIGAVYLLGRFMYRRSYLKDPAGRGAGFLLTILPTAVLIVAGLAGALTGGRG
ncbi:MAG: MAPEG family protein [Burkholderiaceae bacterium]